MRGRPSVIKVQIFRHLKQINTNRNHQKIIRKIKSYEISENITVDVSHFGITNQLYSIWIMLILINIGIQIKKLFVIYYIRLRNIFFSAPAEYESNVGLGPSLPVIEKKTCFPKRW